MSQQLHDIGLTIFTFADLKNEIEREYKTFPRTLSQEDMQSGTEPRAQTPNPVFFPFRHRRIHHELIIVASFLPSFSFVVLFDLRPFLPTLLCTCVFSPYSLSLSFFGFFISFTVPSGTTYLTADRGSFASLLLSLLNFLRV